VKFEILRKWAVSPCFNHAGQQMYCHVTGLTSTNYRVTVCERDLSRNHRGHTFLHPIIVFCRIKILKTSSLPFHMLSLLKNEIPLNSGLGGGCACFCVRVLIFVAVVDDEEKKDQSQLPCLHPKLLFQVN
jgi:hypothetical protein